MEDSILDTYKLEQTFYCRFHSNETYQLYCKDCHDFVCFECIGKFHEKHFLCRLQDAEEDIRNQIGISFSENHRCITKIEEFKEIIDQNVTQLSNDEDIMEHQIKTNAENMTKEVRFHEKCMLSELHGMFQNLKIPLKELITRVENLRSFVTKFDVHKLPESKLEEMINVLSKLKACTLACDKLKNYQKPNFSTDISCGNSIIVVEVSGSTNSSSMIHSSVSTQTEDPDDSDIDDEWFDTGDDLDEDSIERSSDEIKEDKALHVYKLNKKIGRIKKICPVSENGAWILAQRQVFKFANQSLDCTVFVDDVDDIVVLKDGCVLVLISNSKVILKIFKNMRVVKFANAGNMFSDMRSYCFCNSTDDSLEVYCMSESRVYTKCSNSVEQWNKDGVLTGEIDFITPWYGKPYLMQKVNSNLCVLYHQSSYNGNSHTIKLLRISNDKCDIINSFDGLFGFMPDLNFDCYGICTVGNNLIVSDISLHSVQVLGEHFNFKKCLVDATYGIDKPTAIAFYNNQFWIADSDKILIFDLNDTYF